jgi:uncharacterized membrane protein YhiD involved in acid resistance
VLTKKYFQYLYDLSKAFAVRYWKYLITIVIITIAYLSSRRKAANLISLMRDQDSKHADDIERIRKVYERERDKKAQADKRKKDTLKKIEMKFKENNEKLDSKKRAEIEKLLAETNADPDVITNEISKITGFKIHDGSD